MVGRTFPRPMSQERGAPPCRGAACLCAAFRAFQQRRRLWASGCVGFVRRVVAAEER